jgi:hypothetical protein
MKEPGADRRRRRYALERSLASFGVTTVEGSDADGEHDVVRLFVGLEDEILDRGLTDAQAARGDLVGGGGSDLRDG